MLSAVQRYKNRTSANEVRSHSALLVKTVGDAFMNQGAGHKAHSIAHAGHVTVYIQNRVQFSTISYQVEVGKPVKHY